MAEQTLTIDDAMQVAVNLLHHGDTEQPAEIARKILTVRPEHAGARHLALALQHGVNNLQFTAVHLHRPDLYDIGDFSYGVPAVFHHNQPNEPAPLRIGRYCTIAHDVNIYLGSYHRHDWYTIYPFSAPHFGTLFAGARDIEGFSSTRGGVQIGNDVWIGAHSIILSGVTIGDGAVIAAGSVVSRDVGPYEIWAGNPAQLVKRRFDEETSATLLRLRWWDWPKEDVEANARSIMNVGPHALEQLVQAKAAMIKRMSASAPNEKLLAGATGVVRVKVPQEWKPGAPTWLVLHGSLGRIERVEHLASSLPEANLVFADLPGSGHSWHPTAYSAEAFARELLPALRQVIDGPYRVLGVSFGGAVGLAMAHEDASCHGVLLLDTPFSAAKLWHNQAHLRNLLSSRKQDNQHARRFAWEMYGVSPHAVAERTYWHLLDGLQTPVRVLTGNIPLMPPRENGENACCLDMDDLVELSRRGIPVHCVASGHNLVEDNPQAVADAARAWTAEAADAIAA
ncbi:alpha/beta fold hydrolase [Cupriavidus campinensis]